MIVIGGFADETGFENSIAGNCSLSLSQSLEEAPILSLIGEVDLSCAPRLFNLMWQTSNKGGRSLIIDLEKLDYMDSSGLQILLRLREKLRAKKQEVILVAPKPQIRKLFRLTGFDGLFSLYDNSDEAIHLLRNSS